MPAAQGIRRLLDPAELARIHRSTVCRLDRVREIQPWFKGESVAVLVNGPTLRVGGSYRDEFIRRLTGTDSSRR